MPNEDEKTLAELKELKSLVEGLEAELKNSDAYLTKAEAEVEDLKKKNADLTQKLKAAKSAPTGDYVVFEGKTYAILGDYRSDQNFEPVKKGYCDEGITLIAIARPH